MNPTTSLIEVHDLKVAFRTGKTELHPAVDGVSFDIPANTTVALVGESGSGKSVSAMSIVGLLPDNAVIGADSRVLYQGADLLRAPAERMRRLRGKEIS
ncbi:MAG TPA: ATP-binding cassette domain-containing protein, partial [Ramlibacter sp.]|nr:ATP-binding cassette domain-containing protein [Ramlibacter sp.]